jgi:3-deoxy-7-phosphoheptulonate synthase
MIVVMEPQATEEQIKVVEKRIQDFGYKIHKIVGTDQTVLAAVGDERGKARLTALESCRGVMRVVPILNPFKLSGREVKKEDTVITVRGHQIGGPRFTVIAGPCSVESEEQMMTIARAVKKSGAHMLRGGAFKPRSSPYAFQGMEEEGLKLLAQARKETGLPVVTEVMNPRDIELVSGYVDILQVGARNIANYALLKELGQGRMPIILKRGMSTTLQELMMSAEYILSEGNREVILCERGIRTFETATRNTFDISAVPLLKEWSHLPVIADPSHGAGLWQLVVPLAKASLAAGAHGIMVEVHHQPEEAFSDGPQSLLPKRFDQLMLDLRKYAALEKLSME